MDFRGLMAVAVLLAASSPAVMLVSGQAVATSCTAAMITSFTPCLGYITGTGSSSSSPTVACCKSMEAVVNTSASCACLVLTGSVPLVGAAVPFNRTLAVTLPKACNSTAVPLQCKDTSSAPGPAAAVSPTMPPTTTTAEAPAPAVVLATPPATSQPQTKPQVVPSSAWRALPALVLLMAAGAAVVVVV